MCIHTYIHVYELYRNSLLIEEEKAEINRKLMANNKNLEHTSEISLIESNKLKNEHEKLIQKILDMENEKTQLALTLEMKEKESRDESEKLAKRLDLEKYEFSLASAQMEKEKNDLLLKIKADENLAYLKSLEIKNQENEKLLLEKNLMDIETEKNNLNEKMKKIQDDNEKQKHLDEQNKKSLDLQIQIDEMMREKKEYLEKLEKSEILAKERELLIEENSKKELQLLVEKMKNERNEDLKKLKNENSILDGLGGTTSHSSSFLKKVCIFVYMYVCM
jgi:hypothetical protein